MWRGILNFLTAKKALLNDVDKESGFIMAELPTFEDDIADCGSDSTMETKGRRASLNILVRRANGKVDVNVNAEFKESRQMMQAFDTITCNSKGVLEKQALDAAGT